MLQRRPLLGVSRSSGQDREDDKRSRWTTSWDGTRSDAVGGQHWVRSSATLSERRISPTSDLQTATWLDLRIGPTARWPN